MGGHPASLHAREQAHLQPAGLGRAALLSAVKLALGWSAGLGLVWVLGLTGTVRGVVLIEMAMPVAVFNYLFAQRYGNRPEEVAGLVLVSTVLAFALLPVLLWLAWGGAPPPGVAGAPAGASG
jgi:predicted permease